jgi:hypothetical protein
MLLAELAEGHREAEEIVVELLILEMAVVVLSKVAVEQEGDQE